MNCQLTNARDRQVLMQLNSSIQQENDILPKESNEKRDPTSKEPCKIGHDILNNIREWEVSLGMIDLSVDHDQDAGASESNEDPEYDKVPPEIDSDSAGFVEKPLGGWIPLERRFPEVPIQSET